MRIFPDPCSSSGWAIMSAPRLAGPWPSDLNLVDAADLWLMLRCRTVAAATYRGNKRTLRRHVLRYRMPDGRAVAEWAITALAAGRPREALLRGLTRTLRARRYHEATIRATCSTVCVLLDDAAEVTHFARRVLAVVDRAAAAYVVHRRARRRAARAARTTGIDTRHRPAAPAPAPLRLVRPPAPEPRGSGGG
jgi:hypothetical protein